MIGTGIMGSGMAANLVTGGHFVHIYMRSPEKLNSFPENIKQKLNGPGVRIFSDIRSASEGADLAVLCLTEDEVVRNAFFDSGLLEAKPTYIIDTGTTSPELSLEMAAAADKKGISFLDSPMTGSKLAAESGQILFMVGGEKSAMEELGFFFSVCGKNAVHCGPVSSGQRVKIALNMVQAGLFQVYLEGFQLALKEGASGSQFLEILKQSAAASPLLDFKMGCVMKKDYSPNFALKNMNKDMNHAMQRAKELHSVLPLSSSLKSIYEAGMAAGFGEEDFCSLAKISEGWNSHPLLP